MGNRASSQEKKQNFWDETKKSIRDGVDEEITKRMMMQREIQMSVNIAKARDALHVFGSLWLTFTSGVTIATLAKKPVPKVLFAPVVIGSVVLGNMADMAYGNKLARVNKEAAYILENERYRFVPFPQAPFARFYSDEERALFYDEATAVESQMTTNPAVVDIGINLTHKAFGKHWKEVVQRAIDDGVTKILLTGTSIQSSRANLAMAQEWFEETGQKNLYTTVGIHPHDAKTWKDLRSPAEDGESSENPSKSTLEEMREMLKHPLAVAVGECGLDYNRNFSSPASQVHAFKEQIQLAIQLKKPLFVHEREGHADLIKIFDEVKTDDVELPPIVIHCFTGTKEEALEYIQKGFHIGFTGTICKKQRGKPLRELIPSLPLDKLMVETDAPFMGFKKGRRSSEPSDCVDVARKLAEALQKPFDLVATVTTRNATIFFGLD
ncbi:MAG: hypothetical protein SGBAC_007555 [Bacillariaceae sp.]